MSLKDLFSKGPIRTSESLDEIGREVESADFVKEAIEDSDRFIPDVDYSKPDEFVRYGLAELYYENAILGIPANYPYDGSLKEKMEWRNHATNLDLYMYDQQYPKSTGYASFSPQGWGTQDDAHDDYGSPTTQEYILFKGGPHSGTIHQPSKSRLSNLRFGGTEGSTVEFWLYKSVFDESKTSKEVVLDVYTTSSLSSSGDYGRLRIEMSGTSEGFAGFYTTFRSGSSGFENQLIDGSGIDLTGWNHCAFSFFNSGGATGCKFYYNGELHTEIAAGTDTSQVSGALVGAIGSLANAPEGTEVPQRGWAKLSGSIDEFRYWTKLRTGDQIGKYWFTQIGGGTDTDDANTDLGVYYKFNEGITGDSTYDSVVLDYSGRKSNGVWVGYGDYSRNTGSAIVSSSIATPTFEVHDPIMHLSHSSVQSLLSNFRQVGQEFDYRNAAGMYESFPAWVRMEDEHKESYVLRNLTQIAASYLDTLHLQIEKIPRLFDNSYASSSHSTNPFADRLLSSYGLEVPSLFEEASFMEQYGDRNHERLFAEDLQKTKDTIYKNLYNNLAYIYKSKGTEKSFRNTLRCFGIDEELVKLNIYGDNVTYRLEDNRVERSVPKKYLNFHDSDHYSAAVVGLKSGSLGSIEKTYVTPDYNGGFTLEAGIYFPATVDKTSEFFVGSPFLTSSLFGAHSVGSASETTWSSPDSASFQVFAVKPERDSRHCYFALSSSVIGFPVLTSSMFYDVYNGSQWVFAVKKTYDSAGSGSGGNALIEFQGVNSQLGTIVESFALTGTLAGGFSGSQRPYIGSFRQNATGSSVLRTDVQASHLRYWNSYLPRETVVAHSHDIYSYGTDNPFRNTSDRGSSYENFEKNLFLNWDFASLTSSDAAGEFEVIDASSGSSDASYHHVGKGIGFSASSTDIVDASYALVASNRQPEVIVGTDMVQVNDDFEVFTKNTRPIKHFYSFEKNMYQTISEEMLKMFDTISSYGSLIGQPVNRYRDSYKSLEKLRELFFRRVENTPDLERYIEFYKWIDSAIGQTLEQLTPASARFSKGVRTVVESHVLERNKYRHKFPHLKTQRKDLIGVVEGTSALRYNWRYGHHPIDSDEGENCLYWKQKALRTDPPLSSSIASVNDGRDAIFDVLSSSYNRNESTSLFAEEVGIRIQQHPLERAINQFRESTRGESVKVNFDTNDEQYATFRTICSDSPNLQVVVDHVVETERDGLEPYLPFTLISSSAQGGYHDSLHDLKTGLDITRLHLDGGDAPMQGTFTEEHVGGYLYRHVSLNTGFQTATTRPEGFSVIVNTSTDELEVVSPSYLNGALNHDLPRGQYKRGEGIKRAVNVKNIKDES